MVKTNQEKLLQTPTVIFLSAKEEHNHNKLAVKIANPQQPINSVTFDKKTYNLRDRSKAESSKEKVPTFSDSGKQQQSSRNPQHGQKDDDDIEQNNQRERYPFRCNVNGRMGRRQQRQQRQV